MRSYKLPTVDLDQTLFVSQPNWSVPALATLDLRLKSCKSKLDAPYQAEGKRFESYTMHMEPSRAIYKQIVEDYGPQFPTNAWIKLIEMISEFGLARDFASQGLLQMFDNASAPGAFILAMNYWTTTIEKMNLFWVASTLMADDTNTALGDTYGLARNYPKQFATHDTPFNGDTTDARYLRFIEANFHNKFDLYTSDLGMFVPADKFNFQEAINARGNLGQILMGLIVLRRGGALVTKQFTHMSSFTISLMAIIAGCFDDVRVVKPIASKPDNSEEYIVARGYKLMPEHIRRIMFAALEEPWDIKVTDRDFAMPLISQDCLNSVFLSSIIHMTNDLVELQCAKINANLAEYMAMKERGTSRPSKKFMDEHVFPTAKKWFSGKKLKRMDPANYLKMR